MNVNKKYWNQDSDLYLDVDTLPWMLTNNFQSIKHCTMTHIDMSTLSKAQTNNQNHKLNCTQKWKSKFIWIKNYRRKTIEIKIYWNRNWNQKWDVIAFNINLGSDLHFDVDTIPATKKRDKFKKKDQYCKYKPN